MEYLLDRGPYTDVPLAEIESDLTARHPRLVRAAGGLTGDLAGEAEAERR